MLQKPAPEGLLEPITWEAMTGILHLITQLYRSENRLLRIRGSLSMLYLVTMVLIMFPDDATLVVEDTIVQQGPKELIILEVGSVEAIALNFARDQNGRENFEGEVGSASTGTFPEI